MPPLEAAVTRYLVEELFFSAHRGAVDKNLLASGAPPPRSDNIILRPAAPPHSIGARQTFGGVHRLAIMTTVTTNGDNHRPVKTPL